jgi:general stress protein YciG
MVSILFMNPPVWMSRVPDQRILGNLISRITVSFDNVTKKHRLDVEFSDTVSRIFDNDSEDRRTLADSGNLACRVSGGLGEYPEPELRSDAGKKSGGSRIKSAAERNYSVTVE